MKFRPQFIASVAVLVVAIALVALFASGAVQLPSIGGQSKDAVAANAKSLYELVYPGVDISVLTATEQNGMYKVVLKAVSPSGTTYPEVYVTKDGKLLTENMVLVDESISQMRKMRVFVDCLDSKGVRIAVVANQTSTLLPVTNVLGVYGQKLLFDCGTNLDACISANVTQVPSVVIGQYIIPGMQTADWFSRVTGCELNATS
jgi:hypothetical protein